MSSYMNEALAYEKMQRYQAEAERHRRIKAARPLGPGAMDRLVQAIGRGLESIADSLRVDRRPQLPAV